MKRLLEKQLSEWLISLRRKPLVIRGARQVGKSTLVRQFAESQGYQLVEVNLERFPLLNSVFQTQDLQKIIPELEVAAKQSIVPSKSLLFLDEIQATPQALASLRYFYEDLPELAVIAAGSLLEFVLEEHSFSMPVGRVEYLHLGPMSFSEFLLAMDEEQLLSYLEKALQNKSLPLMAHQKLLQYQREYLFVGGMPEAVLAYQETKNFEDARRVQRSIIQTYQDDFSKYSKKSDEYRLHHILSKLPEVAGNKLKYSEISSEERSGKIKKGIELLTQARLFIPAFHTDARGVPLNSQKNEKVYKLFFIDIGLLNYLYGLDWKAIISLDERALVNEGILAEQFIAQHLAYWDQGKEPPTLFYWLRESKSVNAEVDFITQQGSQVIPIEVKAGKSGSLKSLHQIMFSHSFKHAYRFDLNPPSEQQVEHTVMPSKEPVNFTLISLPTYLIEFLPEWVSNNR